MPRPRSSELSDSAVSFALNVIPAASADERLRVVSTGTSGSYGTDLPRSDAESPVPVAGDVLDAEGEPVGGLLLFVGDGLLSSLEVYSEADVDPLPLPRADRVRWSDRAHASDPAD